MGIKIPDIINCSFSTKGYSEDELEKIGNAIIFFATKNAKLSKTKLLKLIYLLDEISVKRYGIPVLGLEYRVWQAGPVNTDIYSELTADQTLLKDHIEVTYNHKNECYIKPKHDFKNDEFSDNEVDLLNTINDAYGKYTAKDLVDICHKQTTLWYKISKENGVLELFQSGKMNTTDYKIDLSEYIKDEPLKLARYNQYCEFVRLSKGYKN